MLPARRGAIRGDRCRLFADHFHVQRPHIARPIAGPPRVTSPLRKRTTEPARSRLWCSDALAEASTIRTIGKRTFPSADIAFGLLSTSAPQRTRSGPWYDALPPRAHANPSDHIVFVDDPLNARQPGR